MSRRLNGRLILFASARLARLAPRNGGESREEHRTTRPYTPRTNGMVERFNGRVQREVLGITIYSYHDLEVVLRGFNVAYNARRQRVLNGLSPEMVLRQRLEAEPTLVNFGYNPPKPGILQAALSAVADAKEVSHPDS